MISAAASTGSKGIVRRRRCSAMGPRMVEIIPVLTVCLLWLTTTIDASPNHSQVQRGLQIPGIFDLSVGSNSNANTNSNVSPISNTNSITNIETTESTTEINVPQPQETPAPTDPVTAPPTPTPAVPDTAAPSVATLLTDTTSNTAATTRATTEPTQYPTPIPGVSASYTSSGHRTPFPTVPISLLDLPATVDITECRKRLQIVDADRNSWLNEEEYIQFVHQVVSHQANNHNIPISGDVWGHTLEDLPPGIQVLYRNLNQGGAIEIVGYKEDGDVKPSLVQELFLIKVCVHTEVVVHQVLKASGVNGEDTTQTAYSIPDVEVVSVYSSFQLSNRVGLTSANLGPDSGTNRKGLDEAYCALVTQVVGNKVGQDLAMTIGGGRTSDVESKAGTDANREATRHRQLTVAIDPKLPEIYRIDNTPCPGQENSTRIQTEWCSTGYGKFLLYLVGEDDLAIYDEYSQAVQRATAEGQLQALLEQMEPAAEVKVTDAGATILPPPPTPAPTPFDEAPPPTLESHDKMTVPEPQLTVGPVEEGDEKHENMEMIFVLAGILMMVNCCIISVSVYMCWKNRNNADIDLGVYDEDPSVSEAYYDNLRASRKKRMMSSKKQKRSGSSRSNFSESSAPTMDDIMEAQTPGPAPAPSPVPYMHDAQSRERILRGQGSSNISNLSGASSAAPTKEEIEETLKRSAAAGSRPPQDRSVRFEDESDHLPVNAGLMA